MKNTFILLFLGGFCLAFGQKIKIVDSETSNPIPNARIFSESKNFYTNEEGYVIVPESKDAYEIDAFGYQPEKAGNLSPLIKLKPLYNNIEEVKIVPVDFLKIIKSVSGHYSDHYYSSPALYDVTVKQKSAENNSLTLLMVADGKFWSSDGKFNIRKSANDKFDDFVQLQIDNLRFLKTKPLLNTAYNPNGTKAQDIVGDLFLDYELLRTIYWSTTRNAKISGRLLYEKGDEQQIAFTIKLQTAINFEGKFTYNKKDDAISYFELNATQSNSEPQILKDENGNSFKKQLGDASIIFNYYKKDGKYFPAKISRKSDGFKIFKDGQTFVYKNSREFIFKDFHPADKKGLSKPVKISDRYWYDLAPTNEIGEIVLTKEEQDFINEK